MHSLFLGAIYDFQRREGGPQLSGTAYAWHTQKSPTHLWSKVLRWKVKMPWRATASLTSQHWPIRRINDLIPFKTVSFSLK